MADTKERRFKSSKESFEYFEGLYEKRTAEQFRTEIANHLKKGDETPLQIKASKKLLFWTKKGKDIHQQYGQKHHQLGSALANASLLLKQSKAPQDVELFEYAFDAYLNLFEDVDKRSELSLDKYFGVDEFNALKYAAEIHKEVTGNTDLKKKMDSFSFVKEFKADFEKYQAEK